MHPISQQVARRSLSTAALAVFFLLPISASAQVSSLSSDWRELDRLTDIVVPNTRSFVMPHRSGGVELASVRATVKILEETASTTLELELVNHGAQPAEAIVVLPVPDDAAVSGFALEGTHSEAIAQLLPRDQARRLYDEIVRRLKDPGLLEFAGHAAVRSSVFPIPAGGRQRVRLAFDHLLPRDGERVDYELPRSESLTATAEWSIDATLTSKSGVAMVYSPSHDLETTRITKDQVNVRLAATSRRNPGAFRLSYLRSANDLTASLFAYPDPRIGGGYFLLMAGMPALPREAKASARREVTVVLDRSGSMAGGKMEKARAAGLQVIEGLADGEWFNIVDYSTAVSLFATQPVQKDARTTEQARAYLAALRPNGGTNIYDALTEALRQPHATGTLPLVLFLTDGLPTVRATSETVLRELVEKGNPHQRRIFTFGVGADVNVPLLDKIADSTRAAAAYVLPGEDVELAVEKVYRRLFGPVLASVELVTLEVGGAIDPRRIRDVMPPRLPDLFDGDSLIVLGQYVGDAPLAFRVSGQQSDRAREFRFELDVRRATTRNAFVPRLWATRQIAYLVDQVRELGAGGDPLHPGLPQHDPRLAELTQEILRLSTEFGILTEYTAFLATDGNRWSDWGSLSLRCNDLLNDKAVLERSGAAAVAQGANFNERKSKSSVDFRNTRSEALGEKLERVEVATVQQAADRCYFQDQGKWLDARLIGAPEKTTDQEVVFGTSDWQRVANELIADGRQSVFCLRGAVVLDHRGVRLLLHLGGQ